VVCAVSRRSRHTPSWLHPFMIGLYDSGYGGLTVLGAVRAALPHHDYVYLGDNGRAPYGGRDANTVLDFAEQCVERLLEEGCRLIVVACHTVSCTALRHLQQKYAADPAGSKRILGVTIPTAEAAVTLSNRHIGILGTARTVQSGTFAIEIRKLSRHQVTAVAAPLLAAIVEEGWEQSDIALQAVERYVSAFEDIDTLVLACTHYPLLRPAFDTVVGGRIHVLDPSPHIARKLVEWLKRHPGFVAQGHGTLRALCSGDPDVFKRHARRFLGSDLPLVQHVAEEHGRLAHRARVQIAVGQIVR
jgi:glutamate racemase